MKKLSRRNFWLGTDYFLNRTVLFRQEDFHDRVQELQHHSKRTRDELGNCKNEVSALEKKLQAKESEVRSISKQVRSVVCVVNDNV